MPIYVFKCPACGKIEEQFSRMLGLEELKQNMICCDDTMVIVIQSMAEIFNRSAFPAEYFEHADYEPRKFRDKHELLDHCEEVGLRSRLLEDGDVP